MTIPPYYKGVLSNLKVHYTSGKSAPHKAILLLAISDLIESGAITKDEIGMTEELKEAFEVRWDRHVPKDSQYKSAVWTPYWHMGEKQKYIDWFYEAPQGVLQLVHSQRND